jgi:transposase InsO family protein
MPKEWRDLDRDLRGNLIEGGLIEAYGRPCSRQRVARSQLESSSIRYANGRSADLLWTSLVDMALQQRRPRAGVIHHSDRGSPPRTRVMRIARGSRRTASAAA